MKRILLHIVFCFLSTAAIGCSCLSFTLFCEGINPNSNVSGVEVLQTYLLDNNGITLQYVDVVVLDHLQGITPADTLTFLVSDGTSCSPFPNLMEYLPGDKMFVSTLAPLSSNPNGFPTFHGEPACAEVMIFANKGANTVDYDTFKKDFLDCVLLTKEVTKEELERSITMFPNPTINHTLWLYFTNPLYAQVTVFTADGRRVMSLELEKSHSVPIDISHWSYGVYYIRLEAENVEVVKKFVKL